MGSAKVLGLYGVRLELGRLGETVVDVDGTDDGRPMDIRSSSDPEDTYVL